MLNLLGAIDNTNDYALRAAAQERGYQRGQRQQLNQLSGQAWNAPPEQRSGLLSRLASIDPQAAQGMEQLYQTREKSMRESAINLAKAWKSTAGADPAKRQAFYQGFMLPSAQRAGLPIPQNYDEKAFDQEAEALIAMGNGGGGDMIQSTFVDAQGNRVGVLRNGGTVTLGQNAPNNQIIDTGNGFYGVNKGDLNAAPVMVGGHAQASSNWAQPGATYQTPHGVVRIDPNIDPAALEAAQADIANGGQANSYELPQRDAQPQQLRSAPKPQAEQSAPSGYAWKPDGSLGPIPGGPADPAVRGGTGEGQVIQNDDGTTTFIPAGKISEQERNAAGFYSRMTDADKTLGELERAKYDPTNLRDYLTVGGKVLNGLSSDQGQRYYQAAQNWVRANLRKESGAAIGAQEMEQEIRNYFPQFGDSEAVIRQKAHNRSVVENAMRTAAGRALPTPSAKPAGGGQPASGSRVLRYNPATGDFD